MKSGFWHAMRLIRQSQRSWINGSTERHRVLTEEGLSYMTLGARGPPSLILRSLSEYYSEMLTV